MVVTDPDHHRGLPAGPRVRPVCRHAAGGGAAADAPSMCRPCCAGPRAHQIAVVPRGMGTGLSGGATALDGAIVLTHREDARHHRRPRHPHRRRPTRTAQRRGQEGGRRARALVSAGPVVVRDLQHRRQHRHQRRRAVLREVRRHHRLRAGPAGGAGRRHRGATRRAAAQGCRGTVADQTVRRQRGHARSDHRSDPATAAAPSRSASTVVATFDSVEAAAQAVVDITGKMQAVDAGVHGRGVDQCRRGQAADGPGPRCRRDDGGRHRRPRTVRRSRTPSSWPTCSPKHGAKEVFSTVGPRRGRGVRRRPPVLHSRGGGSRARCCWRTSASRCPRWPTWSAASARSPPTTT